MAPDPATPDIKILVTRSASADGAVVVFIDTTFEPDGSDGSPGLRVVVNEDPAYEGKLYEYSDDSRGIAGEAALEVSLRQIDYDEHEEEGGHA